MADDERYERGVEMIKKVYAGDVVVPPKGAMAFSDLMLESLFAEVWTREELSIRDRRLILFGAAACLSHLLLDTFYNHGNGLAMFWPASEATLAFPIPWFETIKSPLASVQNLKTFAIEFACYAPLLLLATVYLRRRSTATATEL